MKNNKKLVLGSVVALALSVGVLAPNLTKADNPTVTKEMAKAQAEEALKQNPINNDYDLTEIGGGNWTYVLKINPNKPITPSASDQKAAKEAALKKAKEDALAGLKSVGITEGFLVNQINKAQTPEGVEALKPYAKQIELNKAKEDAIKELKEAGITANIYLNQINKASTVASVENLKNELLKANAKSNKDGYFTREEAEAAAKRAIKKDPVNKSYTISKTANGRYVYKLSPVEEGLEIGYETREEAEAAAKEALENDPINNDFEINKGADGRYYFRTFYKEPEVKPEDPKEPEVKPEDPKNPEVKKPEVKPEVKPEDNKKPETKKPEAKKPSKKVEDKKKAQPAKAVVKKVNNINTGVAGLTGVVATLAASAVALFKSKRK